MSKKRQHQNSGGGAVASRKKSTKATLKFEDGPNQFRFRLVCSLLTLKPISIRNIRRDDIEEPGLRDHEVAFLKLLDMITDGSSVEINNTGTSLRFKPGLLLGGDHVFDDCEGRSIGWFMEGILPLAPFGKEPLSIHFKGITDGHSSKDLSVDYIQAIQVPILQHFGVGVDGESLPPEAKVIKRGQAPLGGGEASLFCPIVKSLSSTDFTDPGKFKRARGTVIGCRISPSSSARVAHAAKGVMHNLLPDVWIHTETHSGSKHRSGGCGPSPGLGVWMTLQSTTGVLICSEVCKDVNKSRGTELPEDLGQRCAYDLLKEAKKGGCVDTHSQQLYFLLMSGAAPEDVSRIRTGTLSKIGIASLRLIKLVFGIEFKVIPCGDKTLTLSCLGAGYRNMARASAA